jgi:peptidoglycan/LPS O-acetylase OafA/YrhL
LSNNELVSLGALAVACLFAAGFLLRSWRRRRTRPPLVGAAVVLVVGAGAIVLAMLGVPYRTAVGFAFIVAMGAVLVSARADRRLP